jgi:hypothetical protein
MTIRYSHLMAEHLHDAMRRYGAKAGTNPGTSRADIGGQPAVGPAQDDPAEEPSTIPPAR